MAFVTLVALAPAGYAQVAELPLKRSPRPTQAPISIEDLMTRLYIFADDSMEGRAFLKPGNVKATNYLAAELRKLGLEPGGDSGTYFQTLPYNAAKGQAPSRNVIAILRGTDPTLNQTYVAIGAHNDHKEIRRPMGRNGIDEHDSLRAWRIERRRLRQTVTNEATLDSLMRPFVPNVDSLRKLRPARRDSIHNGADDDGSGSVAVLEIAEALAKLPTKPKRSILFIFHTGEERNLQGSYYFTTHPSVPHDSIITYLNLDMVGRGRAEDIVGGGPDMLMVIGARSLSAELGELVDKINAAPKHTLRLDYSWDAPDRMPLIWRGSDHFWYGERGIPVVLFFTGLHIDYHEVTDEPQYIDYPHLEKITKYVYDLTLALGNRPTRPVVNKAVRTTP